MINCNHKFTTLSFEDLGILLKSFIVIYVLHLAYVNFRGQCVQPWLFCESKKSEFYTIPICNVVGFAPEYRLLIIDINKVGHEPRTAGFGQQLLGGFQSMIKFMVA